MRNLAVVALALLALGCGEPPGDPLARMKIPVTEGAAAGYVADKACARCHADLYRSYSQVGMARSFYRPRAENAIEDFGGPPFFHEESQRYYRMRREGERLFFERWQLDAEGRPAHPFEVEVDWILGSGHTSRTYLFQEPGGELFQLPIAWYSQTGRWGMAPGFDQPEHSGLSRRVPRECMFCHNAYPEVPEGSDAYGAPQVFPAELPEGIGCQRCHGPGAEHVRAAVRGEKAMITASIFNPAELPPERAMEVCYSCHFQPTVALAGLRRYGRPIYSYRPGEPLTDYMVMLDVEQADRPREERFEINHHPYRLEQSTCFARSEPGALTCMRCHDPHRKVPATRRAEHYREACLSCHAESPGEAGHNEPACSLDAMRDHPDLEARGLAEVAPGDCVSCHMPRRRTQDVVQVVMTDHRIQRVSDASDLSDLLAPLRETTPIIVDVELLHPPAEITPALAQIYRASAVIRAGRSPDATRFLAAALAAAPSDIPPRSPEPSFDLIRGHLGQGQFAEVASVATEILATWPDEPRALDWRAIARIRLGDQAGALEDLARSLELAGDRPEPLFNQGILLASLGRFPESASSLRKAVALRPSFPEAWDYLGRVLIHLDQLDEAERALRRSLSLEPSSPEVAEDLRRLLLQKARLRESTEPHQR